MNLIKSISLMQFNFKEDGSGKKEQKKSHRLASGVGGQIQNLVILGECAEKCAVIFLRTVRKKV